MAEQAMAETPSSPDVRVNLADEFRSLMGSEALRRREVKTKSGLMATLRRDEIEGSSEFHISPNKEPDQSYKVLDRASLRVQVRVYPWSRSFNYVTGVESDLLRPDQETRLLKWEIAKDRQQIESLLQFIKKTFEPTEGKEFRER